MKKYIKIITACIATIAMTMISVETASAASWKQDSKGWWVGNEDGTYLVNTWYQSPDSGLWYYMGADGYMLTNTWHQSPNSKLWYYMGADGHMLTNTTTPDGYTVGADGAWITKQTQATNTKDTAVIREVVEAYKAYKRKFEADSYIFICLNDDDIPECICTNGTTVEILTHDGKHESKVKNWWRYLYDYHLYYLKGGNVVSFQNENEKGFSKVDHESSWGFSSIGSSSRRNNVYSIATRSNTSKAIYDDYNNSFGTLTEISLEYEDTYRSIDAAYEAYIAQ